MSIGVNTDSNNDIVINIDTRDSETPAIVVEPVYGPTGAPGQDGFSPIANVTQTQNGAVISITDKNGATSATITNGTNGIDGVDGKDGINGIDGVDGFSPVATVTKSGSVATITITDKNGTTTAEVYDGSGGGGGVSDVKVNNVSVVTSGVANITMPVDINDLSDVNITDPSTGQNLTYDGTSGKWKNTSSSATVAWGGITGTLSDQTDLKNALDAKQATIDSSNKLSVSYVSGLAPIATSGSYNDLINTPTIPNAQIQSDWSQSDNTQVDFIKNKPTIPNAQIQSDWSQSDNTQVDFIKNKPTIPSVPTTLSAFTDDLGSSPTHTHSQYELISKPIDTLSSSGTIALEDNTERSITPTGNVTFALPTVTDNTKTHKIIVQLNLSTVYTIDLGLGNTPHYFHKTAPDLSNTGVYDLIYIYDKANQYWVCGAIEKGVVS